MKTKIHLAPVMFLIMMGMSVLMTSCGDDGTDPEPDEVVLGELKARIDDAQINFITDTKAIDARRIKAGQSVTFADRSTGEPDAWEWTFEGGPTTVTNQSASVAWADAVGQVMVILKVSRSADDATDADTLMIQVGPVEMLNSTVFAFEEKAGSTVDPLAKWFSWTPNDGTISTSLDATDGANGSARSIKLTATTGFGEFQLRPHENGAEFLVSLASETSYVFSFYIKASEALTLSEASVLNVKNDTPVEGWYTPFWSGDQAYDDITVTTSWTKHTYEFTTADLSTFGDEGYGDGTADNAGPFFKHFGSISGSELSVWFDEISLKEKETE